MSVESWDREADVVVIGSGATGLPAAIVAREAGASVIMVEAENHVGGHAITSGGNLPLGGGTSYQKKYGIEDSPDLFFQDLTDWSVVETNGFPPYRYNDREIIRAFADNSVATFEFLLAHGVKVIDRPPNKVGHEIGVSVLRTMQISVEDWPMVHTGGPAASGRRRNQGRRRTDPAAGSRGAQGRRRNPARAPHDRDPPRDAEVRPRHRHRRRSQRRQTQHPRPQGGDHRHRRLDRQRQLPPHVRSAAHRGILRACRHAVVRSGRQRRTRRHGYRRRVVGRVQLHRRIRLGHHQAGRYRLPVRLCQRALVSGQRGVRQGARDRTCGRGLAGRHPGQHAGQALLRRDRADTSTTTPIRASIPYEPALLSQRQERQKYNPSNFINAALAGIGDGHNGGGPIWAIFDADAAARENWNPQPPHVDCDAGFFFSADSIGDARRQDQNEIPARADAAAKSRRHRRALQFIRRCRQGRRFRQAHAALQDRKAAVLRGLGDAGHSRHPRRLAHQCALPGDRHAAARRSPAFIAAANPPAAFPCTACRAPPVRALSPAKTPSPTRRPKSARTPCARLSSPGRASGSSEIFPTRL